jgi:hypothetical protein
MMMILMKSRMKMKNISVDLQYISAENVIVQFVIFRTQNYLTYLFQVTRDLVVRMKATNSLEYVLFPAQSCPE